MTPNRIATKALDLLRRAGDKRVREQSRTYFKKWEKVRFYGVANPRLRQIEKELFRKIKGSWSVREATALCDLHVRSDFVEAKTLGILLLSRYRREFPRRLFKKARGWLRAGHCGNWAATDALCGWALAPLLRKYPDLVRAIGAWSSSENPWIRRASAVALVPMVRRGDHLSAAYATAGALLTDGEDLIHKATGWLLREAGKTDPRRLEAFLLGTGRRISRTALRYAIERFPESRRKAILRATRPSSP